MTQKSLRARFNRRQLIILGVLVIGLYVLVPQLGDFKSSWQVLKNPDWFAVVLAIFCTALTYLAAALTYKFLAFHRLQYGRLVTVQVAAMFINRLLPAGIGALGVNFLYLRQQKHTPAQATTMVGVNNLLGFTGNMLLLAVAVLISGSQILHGKHPSLYAVLLVAAGLTVGALLAVRLFGKRLRKFMTEVGRQLASYRYRVPELLLALMSSMTLTMANVLCLDYCATALGVSVSIAMLLVILTLGVGAGAATPTPGGLGGFEAGMVAGFIAYGVSAPTALAVALLYRLISYWLTLLAGAAAFAVVQHRRWLAI